jgi:hypothetical protein
VASGAQGAHGYFLAVFFQFGVGHGKKKGVFLKISYRLNLKTHYYPPEGEKFTGQHDCMVEFR